MPREIWTEYPEALLHEADESRAEAEASMLAREPYEQDPYNLSMAELLRRWRERQGKNTQEANKKAR